MAERAGLISSESEEDSSESHTCSSPLDDNASIDLDSDNEAKDRPRVVEARQ